LSGRNLDHVDALGQPLRDSTYLIMVNPHWEPIEFWMPKGGCERRWTLVLDTRTAAVPEPAVVKTGEFYELIPRSLALFCEVE
jgi:hypothetical protein